MPENKLSLSFEGADKDQLVAGLAALVAADCGEVTAASMEAVAAASGNTLGKMYAKLQNASLFAFEDEDEKDKEKIYPYIFIEFSLQQQ